MTDPGRTPPSAGAESEPGGGARASQPEPRYDPSAGFGTRNDDTQPAAAPDTERPATEPRPTVHTFEQVNWDNVEQETRIGVLQEMVAILLNRLDETEAAQAGPPPLDVERLALAMAVNGISDGDGEPLFDVAEKIATEYEGPE